MTLVGAAGNDGRWNGRGDNVIYPARYNNVIAVAATDSNDNRASFSSTGPDVELAAPGVNILSTLPGGTYGYKMGTSMACPHVTGTAALVIASDPLLSNDQVRQILRDTADYLGDPYKYGYGLVDADGAAPPTEIPNQLPVADAGLDHTATVGETVMFDGSNSSDPDGTIVSYYWEFDDGNTSTAESPTNVYSTAGIYTVNLTVTDNDGDTDKDTAIVTVTDLQNQPPVSDAGLDHTATVGETVMFDGSNSSDPDGTIVSYYWEFDDGNTSTAESPTNVYSTAGIYTVNLTVTDNDGDTDKDTAIVTVTDLQNQPPVSDAGLDHTATVGETVMFDGSNSSDPDGTIVSYYWEFDDGNTSTAESPTNVYSTAGIYTVNLTVTDNDGDTDKDTAQITVTEAPTLTMHIASIDMYLT